jgi:hypothetical protein
MPSNTGACASPVRGENAGRFSRMKFETYLLLTVIIFFLWKTRRSVRRSLTVQERYFAIRTSIFTWFVGFLLLMALLFLPNKARILLLIPVFLGSIAIARFFRDTRARLRREAEGRVDLDRMKRIN